MTISRTFGPSKLSASPAEELQNFLQQLPAAAANPNNPLATGAMPSANPSAPQLNPHLPGSFTNPANPKLNPNMPGAITNPSNPQFNPNMPGAQNNPSNPQYNPAMPGAVNNPSSPNLNPAFPGAFTNPANPINNPDFPTPSAYPPPQGLSPDASLPPSRWSTFSPRVAHGIWFNPPGDAASNQWGRGLYHAPSKTLYTWPEAVSDHREMIWKLFNGDTQGLHYLTISPQGYVTPYDAYRESPSRKHVQAIEQADPRLRVVGYEGSQGSFGPRQADNWQKDNRDWPDPTEPRMPKPPAPKGCTCHSGQKLDCPIHGLNADYEEMDHTWALPEGQAVSYPQDAPRAWTDAFVSGVQADLENPC